MEKLLIAPGKYVQGSGVLSTAGEYASQLGKKALLIGGETALNIAKDTIEKSLQENDMSSVSYTFKAESSMKEITKIKDFGSDEKVDLVMGVGGGKVIDSAKAVAYYLEIPVIIVPTIAATDAPCSALSVIYTDDGVFEKYLPLPKNPDVVLVDTKVISKAPLRLFVSGMGDALATYFEADACFKSSAPNVPGLFAPTPKTSTRTALGLAELCYQLLMENGYEASCAISEGALTPAVERVVEANTLLSGLGFESSGLAAAHAIHDGLTALEETHSAYHGEKVTIGTLAQIVLEGRDEKVLWQVIEFASYVGLPITLKDIGIKEINEDDLLKVGEASCAEGTTMPNMPFEVTPEMVKDALLAVNALGESVE
ncbi:glycerol dehydrogenase [Natranaerofaba carboxydovora]|uniref:glycerol dehydrogenase n=1 Tax=Natranaerofaba carboxydovora TaxID=2742683 RepID=UPI001F146C06|nr:glycerol dehydrogenase [Natranaerofaba carboxydovora]UMZ72727.1 Glycerol dehydrogenase [Natranaerofaba carboxydovora]